MKNRNAQIFTKSIIVTAVSLVIAGCTGQTVKMIQPQSGATAECSGSSVGFGQLFTESFTNSCARVYENRGFVPM